MLTDRTSDFIAGFLVPGRDRDVALVDVNNDGWLDIVTAAFCSSCEPAGPADDSELYANLGAPGGTWAGFGDPSILFGNGHNFVSVAAGDLTGDGYADLYFVSHLDDYEDQLMINGGAANPGVFTIENDRLTKEMLNSSYGFNAVIADMDGDGWRDIVKSNYGYVEIFANDGGGFFRLAPPDLLGRPGEHRFGRADRRL